MFQEKTHVIFLGLSFLGLLVISSFANTIFLNSLNMLYQNQILIFSMIFMNNIIVVSLIILGMTFYVKLVTLGFFKTDKNSTVIIDHPRIFAIVFSFIVVFLGILRGVNHFFGKITIELLPIILFLNAPIGIIEGYGVYLTIKRTLNRKMTLRSLLYIFIIFIIAAIFEVGIINILN